MQARVAELRAAGLAIKQIAKQVTLNVNTLYRHYAEQLGSRSQAGRRYADPVEAARMPRPALGRPRHQPTIATSATVRQLAADGASLTAIAAAVGVTVPTLRRHYGRELRAANSTRQGGASEGSE